MNIAILTLNLHTNYGGILQAYALQTILQRMGHNVHILDIEEPVHILTRIKDLLTLTQRAIYKSNASHLATRAERLQIMQQNTRRFIDKNITLAHYENFAAIKPDTFAAIVVGSDQVWRPKYFTCGKIEDAFLQFTKDWSIKRIAYAPSFGIDTWEYTPKQSKACAKLLEEFNAVSVREATAKRLCKEYFAVEAQHVIDPTLLLDKEDYLSLIDNNITHKSEGDLLLYILDNNDDKDIVINRLVAKFQLTPFVTNSKVEDSKLSIEHRVQPPVEQWLRAFNDARIVVTDSFHATIFAIIFNKPFVVYGNNSRGNTRFKSLLSLFDLESQLIESSSDLNTATCFNIDWSAVNKRREELKIDGTKFLNVALS